MYKPHDRFGHKLRRIKYLLPENLLDIMAQLFAIKPCNYKLKAQYGLTKGDLSKEEGTLAALGLDYSLGKKTIVYTYVSSLKVDDVDAKDETFSVGLSHSF